MDDPNESRRPIQLQPDVKKLFDELRRELSASRGSDLTQSEVVRFLLGFYREHSAQVKV